MSEHKNPNRDYIDEWFANWYGNRLGNASRRTQGALLGGVAAAILCITPFAIKSEIDSSRQQDTIKQEQKAKDREDQLATKYDVSHLSQESQDAFWRLVGLTPFDIGDTEALYQDSQQTGEWLQQDIAIFNAELVNKGKISDEYDLAEDLIPEDTRRVMEEAGFKFTRLNPVYCDAGPSPSYRPFDYTNHLPKELQVKYVKREGGEVVKIPLGTMQMPAPPEPIDVSTYVFSPLDRFETSAITNPRNRSPIPFYKMAGCAILPPGDQERKSVD